MKSAITDSTGEILLVISGTEEQIALNVPEGGAARDLPEDLDSYWLDGWVPKGIQPDQFSSWDPVAKAWVDQRSLDEIKAQAWHNVKAERENRLNAPLVTDFGVFDADQASQAKLMNLASAVLIMPDYVVEWTMANNSSIWLNNVSIPQVIEALLDRNNAVHRRSAEIREQIDLWMTKADVVNIVY